jgi:DNA-binding beta-propeller fold protein YncE
MVSFGEEGNDPGQLDEPRGLAFHNNQLFVADEDYISVFTPGGVYLRRWMLDDWCSGKPAIDKLGDIYVPVSSGFLKYTSSGIFISDVGLYGAENMMFHSPEGIAVDKDGNLYIADTDNHRVQKLAPVQ